MLWLNWVGYNSGFFIAHGLKRGQGIISLFLIKSVILLVILVLISTALNFETLLFSNIALAKGIICIGLAPKCDRL